MYALIYEQCARMSTVAYKSEFSSWLEEQLQRYGLSQAELAREAGVTRAAINGVLTGARGPGLDLCVAIARAFRIPPEHVLRRAGLLPPIPPDTEREEQILYLLKTLPPEEQADVLEYLMFKAQQAQKKKAASKAAELLK